MHVKQLLPYSFYAPIYQSFAPPPPMRANEGPDQGIRLKFYPQGRGILFTSENCFYNLAICDFHTHLIYKLP